MKRYQLYNLASDQIMAETDALDDEMRDCVLAELAEDIGIDASHLYILEYTHKVSNIINFNKVNADRK